MKCPMMIKTSRSLSSIRNKQYWKMLERLYGGTERAIKGVKSNGSHIIHATSKSSAKKILTEGMRSNNMSFAGKGSFFGSPKLVSGQYNHPAKLRLKLPSELKNSKHIYPKTQKIRTIEGYNKLKPKEIEDMFPIKINPRKATKVQMDTMLYGRDNPLFGIPHGDEQFHVRGGVPAELLKMVKKSSYKLAYMEKEAKIPFINMRLQQGIYKKIFPASARIFFCISRR